MKILQIGKYYYPYVGGIENHLFHLCNELKKACDVQVIVANTGRKTVCENINGISVIRVGSVLTLSSTSICPIMPKLVSQWKGDIVHLHLPNPIATIAYLLSGCRCRLVVSYHSDIIKQKILLKGYYPFLIKLLNIADCIIASSPNYIEYSPILKEFKSKIYVVPYGVDIAWLTKSPGIESEVEKVRARYAEKKLLLFIGRLVYYKGVEYLIKAMADIDATLLIVGEGPLRHQLETTSKKFGLSDKIVFMGKVPDSEIKLYLHACDVFILPSVERSEAFGIVQLEAMACGKPVVSTNLRSGVPYVNQDGKSGLIVPPRNSKAIANAVNKLLNNEDLRRQYGEYARRRVENAFTKEKVAQKVMKIYETLV